MMGALKPEEWGAWATTVVAVCGGIAQYHRYVRDRVKMLYKFDLMEEEIRELKGIAKATEQASGEQSNLLNRLLGELQVLKQIILRGSK